MKTIAFTFFLLLGITSNLQAQEESFNKNLGIGLQLTQIQKDFGVGLNLTSPFFANDKIAIRVKGNLMWNEHLDNNNETTWTPYSNVSLSLVSVAAELGSFVRLYSEGGVLLLLPSDTFSSESTALGGYGLFGFEFLIYHHANYFFEIGGAGTGAKADKIAGKPIYSNGLIINVGFRYQL